MTVTVSRDDAVTTVTLDRPQVRNAVDTEHAEALTQAFLEFDADGGASVAVLYGAGGTFCAGADLKAVAAGAGMPAPPGQGIAGMGPTRLLLSKPVIAAVEGHAVAGGLELAVWCDLRVADPSAVFGVFCRRWGVPLVDGGTIRLPRLIGHSAALDMILTGRPVGAQEAVAMQLSTAWRRPVRRSRPRRSSRAPSRPSRRSPCGTTGCRRTSRRASSCRPHWTTSGGTARTR